MKFFLFFLIFLSHSTFASQNNYIFGWTQLNNPEIFIPRGGTSTGPDVDLEKVPNPFWLRLQNTNLSKFERDRLAILAMQGEYKVNFDFMETMGFVENYIPQKPYQSWGTEFVIVIKDDIDFISLQHIMVMFFEEEDGSVSDPIVVKHWRQDWKYQDKSINTYIGDDTWQKNSIPSDKRKGTWSQFVYQVDDSPRYEGYGKWEHFSNSSIWSSYETSRPLPRREKTIRNDYDLIKGTNIHTITPNGWVHEQNNSKVTKKNFILAREIGLARYQRIKNFDWSAGEIYWKKTEEFWREVREVWAREIENSKKIKVSQSTDDDILFIRLFELADEYKNGNLQSLRKIDTIINEHINK